METQCVWERGGGGRQWQRRYWDSPVRITNCKNAPKVRKVISSYPGKNTRFLTWSCWAQIEEETKLTIYRMRWSKGKGANVNRKLTYRPGEGADHCYCTVLHCMERIGVENNGEKRQKKKTKQNKSKGSADSHSKQENITVISLLLTCDLNNNRSRSMVWTCNSWSMEVVIIHGFKEIISSASEKTLS